MSVIVKKLVNSYFYAMEVWADPRVENYLFMKNPFPVFAIVGVYLYFVLSFGPKMMSKRKAFSLEKLLIIYNGVQIICSLYVCSQLYDFFFFKYNYRCAHVDYGNSPDAVKAANALWFYFMLKIVDLLDTIFFVLRKKNNQITFLHVYHHSGMVIMTWVGTKFVAGGHSIYLPFINSVVHSIMYLYYLLSAYDKSIQKNWWWKKYITQVQLAQFFMLMCLYSTLLFKPDCKYPQWVSVVLTPQYFFITILFLDFYIKSYVLRSNKQQPKNQRKTSSSIEYDCIKKKKNKTIYYRLYKSVTKIAFYTASHFC